MKTTQLHLLTAGLFWILLLGIFFFISPKSIQNFPITNSYLLLHIIWFAAITSTLFIFLKKQTTTILTGFAFSIFLFLQLHHLLNLFSAVMVLVPLFFIGLALTILRKK